MGKATKFAVHYGQKVARFSCYSDAMNFALAASAGCQGLVEVSEKAWLVGQFLNGSTTPEFKLHWRAVVLARQTGKQAVKVQS